MDPISFFHIIGLTYSLDEDDVKDAIVEFFMNDAHLDDDELEIAYNDFMDYLEELRSYATVH